MNSCRLCFFSFLLMMSAICLVYGQQPAALGQKTYETKTKWPGTKFTIWRVKRLDSENVVMVIRVATDATAPQTTFLGFWPNGEPKKPAATVIPENPGQPNVRVIPEHPDPFSLLPSYIIDESNRSQFNAVPQVLPLNGSSYGLSEVVATMNPGSWLQMSVQFKLPTPPPNPDGTIPVQKVDVTLPQAIGPINGVVVPPLTGK